MTPCSLPVEVLSYILDRVKSKGDLCSISLASRALRKEGQRALFRNPGVVKIELPEVAGNTFLDTIINSPHRLGLVVQSFDADLMWEQRLKRQGCGVDRNFLQRMNSDPKNLDKIVSFIDTLERALVLMTNLQNLRIVATRNKALPKVAPPLPSILRKCTFQLRTFYWEHVRTDDELVMSEFLPRQRGLRSLELPLKQSLFYTVYASALQSYTAAGQLNLNLETLCGPAEMTLGLLTNRTDGKLAKVRYMRWTMGYAQRGGIGAGDLRLPHLEKALSNVRLFHFDDNPIGLHASGYESVDIFPMLVNLRVLRFSTSNIRNITQEHVDTISRLTKLQVLVLAFRTGLHMHQANMMKKVADKLFSCCCNLKYIDLVGLTVNPWSERLKRYVGMHHAAPQNGEYSWDDRHLFVNIDENDT